MSARSVARIGDRIIGIGTGALLLFSPFAFGSVNRWALATLLATAFALGGLWIGIRLLERRRIASTGLEIPIVLFLGIVLFQMIPLPRPLLSIVSPRIAALYDKTAPGIPVASREFEDWLQSTDTTLAKQVPAPGASAHGPVTYSVRSTRDRGILFAAYALVFLMVADRWRERNRRQLMILWIVGVGCAVAIEGIFQKIAWNGMVLWVAPPPSGTRPFGPFVNPNHFAGYMELIVPLALGLLLTLVSRRAGTARRNEGDAPEREESEDWRKLRTTRAEWNRGLPWLARDAGPKAVLLAFLFALSLASIFLSLSRGGALAILLTFAIFSWLFVPTLIRHRRRIPLLTLGLAVLLATAVSVASWLGSSAIAERAKTLTEAKTDTSFLSRFDTWKRVLEAVREHAVLGSGLGSFEVVFPGYSAAGSSAVWAEAHNDYLQLLVEVGVVGMIVALFGLGLFLRRALIPAVLQRERPDWYLTVGLAMAIVSMLLHSFVDFSLQIPAVGFLFVVLAGLLAAAASAGDPRPAPVTGWRLAHTALFSAGVLAAFALAAFMAVDGAARVKAERLIKAGEVFYDPERGLPYFAEAARVSPAEPRVVTSYADWTVYAFDASYRPPFTNPEKARALLDRARSCYCRLIEITPCSSWGWWGLGQVYRRMNIVERHVAPSSLEALLPRSEEDLGRNARLGLAALRRATDLEPTASTIYDELAKLYLDEGLRPLALATFTTGARMLPDYSKHEYGPSNELPEDVYRAIVAGMEAAIHELDTAEPADIEKQLGDLASERGDMPEAERRYRLGLAAASPGLWKEVLSLRLGEVLRLQKRYAEAEPLLAQATKSRLVGWWGWLGMGDLRAETGDHRGAVTAYTNASRLSGGDPRPALALARETALAGDRPDAIAQLRYMIGTDPSGQEARALLVQFLRDDGRRREALAEANALLQLAPAKREYKQIVEQLEKEPGR